MADLPAFLLHANHLKGVRRAGWVRNGVADAESVADHAWGVALLAVLLTPAELDRERVLALATVHDLAETITGDITPHDNITPDDKRACEQGAMEKLSGLAGSEELQQLWREYSDGASAEARFVHELDALEMAAQAIAYETAGRLGSEDCDRFIRSASVRISSPSLQAQLNALLASRRSA